MSTTAVVFSPIFYRHNPGRGHPESARRLRAIVRELKKGRLQGIRNWQFVKPEKAQLNDVRLVHSTKYVEFVQNVCRSRGDFLDAEKNTVASPESFDVALYAVGGTLKAVNLIMERKFQNAFALIRPPGHHAGRHYSRGFCIFNSIAIATKHLLRKYKLNRILILDIDSHHGNGTQEIFYETNKVLYVSLHEDPREFPKKGFIDEVGEGEGLGYNVNVPLPCGTGDQIYLKTIHEIVELITKQYKPQFILVSAGLDGHYTDPVGSLSLSALCYQELYQTISAMASEICEGKLVLVLEGGYSLKFVGKLAMAAVAKMSGAIYGLEDNAPMTGKRINEQGERVIKEVRQVQKAFWNV